MTSAHDLELNWSTLWPAFNKIPAQLIKISSRPKVFSVCSIKHATWPSRARSTAMAQAIPPPFVMVLAVSSAPSKFTSATITFAPTSAHCKAVVRPNPSAPPVTTITLSLNDILYSFQPERTSFVAVMEHSIR